ncbi:MAG: flagellar assembly protein FliH [Alphaproteobacteria bacterium]|jgi:flagellar assembly protein FliH|nr:flagellar assembly protein FliH [Alphaproteobacteria bacterium]MEA2988250.1 flagellar assembly protein FliH [Alphaproteobacteria bacterium]
MRAPAKFLFDNDFAGSGHGKPSIALADHAQKLKEAEAAGFARGFAAAQAEARISAEQRSAAAFERMSAALDELGRGLAAVEAKLETEAVEVAVAVAKKLASALIAREPFAEISALATDCFRHLVASPHVVVRVNDALHETARKTLDEIARSRGLESRLVVMAEPEIAPGDCRIEWADGGMTRNSEAIAATIDDAVLRYVAARRGEPYMPEILWRSAR